MSVSDMHKTSCKSSCILHKPIISDVAGGDSASILDAMRRAMDVSSHLELISNQQSSIIWKEAFYLATLGGAKGKFHRILKFQNIVK